MKIKITLLKKHMEQNGMSAKKLASAMDVDESEIEKLLKGEAVGLNTAFNFVEYFGADKSQELIDWKAIGKQNPLACDADKENLNDDKGEIE